MSSIQSKISLQDILNDVKEKLGLSVFPLSSGFDRQVRDPHIQKPGTALTGLWNLIDPNRIQILGKSESEYLNALSEADLADTISRFCSTNMVGIIVTGDYPVHDVLVVVGCFGAV